MLAKKKMNRTQKSKGDEAAPASAKRDPLSKEFEKIYDKDDQFQEEKFQQLNRLVNKRGMAHKIGDVLDRAQVSICEVPML